MSSSLNFIELYCPEEFYYYVPKPSYHPTNPDIVILSTDSTETHGGIYEYNIKTNKFNKIYSYGGLFLMLHGHTQFIDTQNELLYIFGEMNLHIFNLNTKTMNSSQPSVINNCSILGCIYFPKSVYIPSPIHESHIVSNNAIHYKMDMSNKNINKMKIDKFEKNKIKWPNL
eukprot:53621_1